jgi:hypothetical protein
MRKLLSDIVRQIYTAPWANKLSEDGARMAFTADCEAQRMRSVQAKGSNQPLQDQFRITAFDLSHSSRVSSAVNCDPNR